MTSSEKKLYKIIKKEFKVRIREFDREKTLKDLGEQIAVLKEKKELHEVYQLYIGSKELHLPGWISAILALSCGYELDKINVDIKIGEILDRL